MCGGPLLEGCGPSREHACVAMGTLDHALSLSISRFIYILLHYIFVSSISFKVCILGALLVLDFGWVGEDVPLFGLPLNFLGVPNTSPLAFWETMNGLFAALGNWAWWFFCVF